MAVVFALKRESTRANPQQIPETDAVDIATIVRSTAGIGALYGGASDTVTTSVILATGSAVTTITVGGGAAWTGGTYGKLSQTETFLGHVTVNGNLQVNGTSTIVNSTAITTQDVLIESGISTRATGGQNLAYAFYGGSNASKDAMMYWVQGSTRLDFGYGDTGATGGTLPAAPTSWVDVKLNNLTVAGTTVTGVGASLTMQITSANLTVQTVTSGTLAITSAGALNHTSAAASTWTHSGGTWALNSTSAAITLQTTTSGTISLLGAGAITITAAAASTWSTSAGALTLTSAAAATWSTAAGALTLTSAAAATWSTTAGLLSVTGTGGLTLTASGTTDITFNAHGGTTYTFNDGSNLALNAGFTGVTSIIGALNFLFTNPVASANSLQNTYTNNNAGTITQGQCVYITASNAVDLTNASADTGPANFIGVVVASGGIATTASGSIASDGIELVRFKSGRHVPAINDEIFLDVTNNGYAVSFAADAGANPSTPGNVVKSIGYVKNLNGFTAGAAFAGDGTIFVHVFQGPKIII